MQPLRCLFACVAFGACVAGCAPAGRPAEVPTPALETLDPDLASLSASARGHYEDERVALRMLPAKGDKYVLVQGEDDLTEVAFRHKYRALVGAGDLDALARERASRKNWIAVVVAASSVVVSAGGLAALALQHPGPCPSVATASSATGCADAVKGGLSLALLGGVGIYALGCEASKGARCLFDGNLSVSGLELPRADVERFVTRYNAALARSLVHESVVDGAPRGMPARPSDPAKTARLEAMRALTSAGSF